jgi:hypothetical protein
LERRRAVMRARGGAILRLYAKSRTCFGAIVSKRAMGDSEATYGADEQCPINTQGLSHGCTLMS